MKYQDTVKKIREKQNIELEELRELLDERATQTDVDFLYAQAREVADSIYGKCVFKRGLIEFKK